jgi:hypothetical protein
VIAEMPELMTALQEFSEEVQVKKKAFFLLVTFPFVNHVSLVFKNKKRLKKICSLGS